ncbi:MAG: hypothetical protein AMXMBFR53_27980 [Gemmatimonadota bacterium]
MSEPARYVARAPEDADVQETLERVSRLRGVRVLDQEGRSAILLEIGPAAMDEVTAALEGWSLRPEVTHPPPGLRRPGLG